MCLEIRKLCMVRTYANVEKMLAIAKTWKECWESWEKLLLNPSSKSRRKACIVIQHWRNK
jgi:hypothetical protein